MAQSSVDTELCRPPHQLANANNAFPTCLGHSGISVMAEGRNMIQKRPRVEARPALAANKCILSLEPSKQRTSKLVLPSIAGALILAMTDKLLVGPIHHLVSFYISQEWTYRPQVSATSKIRLSDHLASNMENIQTSGSCDTQCECAICLLHASKQEKATLPKAQTG